MNDEKLSNIGLTPGETKVYLALIKHGAQSKNSVTNKACVSSSKVQGVIEKLIKKGLAGSFIKNNVTYYTATNPTFLKQYIEKKENEFQAEKKAVEELIPELQILKTQSKQKINFELYEGLEGVQNAAWQALKDTPKHSTIYGIGVQSPRIGFLCKYHRERTRKKIKAKMIFTEKPQLKVNYKGIDIRFISRITKFSMCIFPDRVTINTFDEQILVIKHPRIVEAFRRNHDILWKQAKKLPKAQT